MKKLFQTMLSCILTCAAIESFAQKNEVSAGGDAASASGSISYTVGQVTTFASSSAEGEVNEGVQQPFEFFVVGIDEAPGIELQWSVFPNPAVSEVLLHTQSPDGTGMCYQLYDISGNVVRSESIVSDLTLIPLTQLAAGTYFLAVSNSTTDLKTFKIIVNP